MKEIQEMTEVELLQTHGKIIEELRHRGVVRTRNNPIGDYTEWLVCDRLGLQVQGNSESAFDAIGIDGIRYQIKGRREEKASVQFSTIRNYDEHGFDYVIAVAFNQDYSIRFAVKIPYEVFPTVARFQSHVRGHNLILTDDSSKQNGIEDIRHLFT